MKKMNSFFLKKAILVAYLLTPILSVAQVNVDSTSKNYNQIIEISGNSIKSPIILGERRKTNEDRLTYILRGNEITIRASELVSFFDGTSMFYSRNVVDQNDKKLIKNIVSGPLYIGQSFKKNGVSVFYIKKENEDRYIQLDNYKYSIESFLQGYLNDFIEFKCKYQKKIFYDYVSLGEFASAYNAYRVPETYVPVEFENPEKLKFGVFGSVNISSLSFTDNLIKFKDAPSYSFGISITDQYTRTFSLDILASYTHSVIEAKVQPIEAVIKTVGIEPSLGASFYINNLICIKVNLGSVVNYEINSGLNLKDEGRSVLIKGFNIGYSSGVDVIYKSKYHAFAKYVNSKINTNNFDLGTIEPSSKRGELSIVRFGIEYSFK